MIKTKTGGRVDGGLDFGQRTNNESGEEAHHLFRKWFIQETEPNKGALDESAAMTCLHPTIKCNASAVFSGVVQNGRRQRHHHNENLIQLAIFYRQEPWRSKRR
jgi:hypothetical protein